MSRNPSFFVFPVSVELTWDGSDWSLRSLFDRLIPRSCNIATSSVVRVLLPSASEGGLYKLSPEPWASTDDGAALYDLTNGNYVLSLDGSGETLLMFDSRYL